MVKASKHKKQSGDTDMTLEEIFDALFSGFYVTGLWTARRWSLSAYPHRYPVYEGKIGVNILDSEVYCYGNFILQCEKGVPLKYHRFEFVWEKDITCENFYTPGLCQFNDMAVSFETGLELFSVAFKESVKNQGMRVLETS